jgi:hypothetical protein
MTGTRPSSRKNTANKQDGGERNGQPDTAVVRRTTSANMAEGRRGRTQPDRGNSVSRQRPVTPGDFAGSAGLARASSELVSRAQASEPATTGQMTHSTSSQITIMEVRGFIAFKVQ